MKPKNLTSITLIVILIRTPEMELVETLELDLAVAKELHGAQHGDDASLSLSLANWWS